MCTVSHVFSHSAKWSSGHSTEFKFDLIHVAPTPVLSWLDRADDGMTCCPKVFCRVLVLRGVATANVATDHAKTKMYPDIPHLQAFFESPRVGFDILDLTGMSARVH